MARQKVASRKATALLEPLSLRKFWTRKGATKASLTGTDKELENSLPYLHKIKEAGKLAHKHVKKTRNNYNGYVAQGIKWLEGHFAPDSTEGPGTMTMHGGSRGSQLGGTTLDEPYEDPAFKCTFNYTPNHCSDKALALFISWKCFHQNCGKSTSDGIYLAFKKYWEEADGDTYHRKWMYNEQRQCWKGNPVQSAEVQDLIQLIKHKVNMEGSVRTHSVAMSKEFMDQINVWATEQLRPLSNRSRSYTNIVNSLLLSLHMTPVELSLEERTYLTRILEMLTFSTAAWNLWTRCFELVKLKQKDLTIAATSVHNILVKYLGHQDLSASDRLVNFEVFLSNRKGWQQYPLTHLNPVDLGNQYKIYLQLDLPLCDCFYWLLLWISFVELVHHHRPLDLDDYIFPAMGTAGIMQPHELLSHDAVQSWINEAVSGAKIAVSNGGKFTTHMYRCGGAQYQYMFAPVGKRFTLAKVRWWGRWAENEHRDTMIWYLLDELHAYKTDHGDALCPIQREADVSLLGEHTLVKLATTEDVPASKHQY
ncbi:hypothetical protein PAXRUDRAFT_792387 [Paxillus rubicundulus Ve08.2h10]|uniref:Ndc10 domain-containing protein n=1 Tax=Paxillus rubicundulus Ve08.2h10 TaxID=930991 RepID=A0A0D0DUB1_9AGAM|nr:hypothetical protein PAXRUDRAFT_792387 [Paxillus rubicundulus Ve08.2h10]